MNNVIARITCRCFTVCLICMCVTAGQTSLGDELILKDGSLIRGKLLKEIPGQSYRMELKDGSEVVYPFDKVESITLGETVKPSPPLKISAPDAVPPEPASQSRTWGAVESSASASDSSRDRNTTGFDWSEKTVVKPFMIGVGFGEYGLFGAKVGLRPVDIIGIEAGVGGYLWMAQYKTNSGKKKNESGLSAEFGAQEHLYFTPRTQRNQHSINFGQYYTDAVGPSLSLGYGYERHGESGIGFNFGIGFWCPVGDYKKYLADKVKTDKKNMDVTIIPAYLELGIFF